MINFSNIYLIIYLKYNLILNFFQKIKINSLYVSFFCFFIISFFYIFNICNDYVFFYNTDSTEAKFTEAFEHLIVEDRIIKIPELFDYKIGMFSFYVKSLPKFLAVKDGLEMYRKVYAVAEETGGKGYSVADCMLYYIYTKWLCPGEFSEAYRYIREYTHRLNLCFPYTVMDQDLKTHYKELLSLCYNEEYDDKDTYFQLHEIDMFIKLCASKKKYYSEYFIDEFGNKTRIVLNPDIFSRVINDDFGNKTRFVFNPKFIKNLFNNSAIFRTSCYHDGFSYIPDFPLDLYNKYLVNFFNDCGNSFFGSYFILKKISNFFLFFVFIHIVLYLDHFIEDYFDPYYNIFCFFFVEIFYCISFILFFSISCSFFFIT